MTQRVAVLGAGSWGTALAIHLGRIGHDVRLWARDAALAGTPSNDALRRATRAVMQVERSLTRLSGLRSRPWFRNLTYAADENNGYANVVFPSVTEALRAGDAALTNRELVDLAARFDAATHALGSARAALAAKSERGARGWELWNE